MDTDSRSSGAADRVLSEADMTPTLTEALKPLTPAVLAGAAERARPGSAYVFHLRAAAVRRERQMAAQLQGMFERIGDAVAGAYEHVQEQMREAVRLQQDIGPSLVSRILKEARLDAMVQREVLDIFKGVWTKSYDDIKEATDRLMQGYHQAWEPIVRSQLERQMFADMGKRIGLLDIHKDTKEALFRILEYGHQQGWNPRTTAQFIRNIVPAGRFVKAGPAYRAQLIARTEVLNAQRQTALVMYRNDPVVGGVEAFDGDYDEECQERDGQQFTIPEAEEESETTHPNCVLCWAPIAPQTISGGAEPPTDASPGELPEQPRVPEGVDPDDPLYPGNTATPLTPKQIEAVRDYFGDPEVSLPLNEVLRFGEMSPWSEMSVEELQTLGAAMDRNMMPLLRETRMWRTVFLQDGKLGKLTLDKSAVGKTFVDGGYGSSSASKLFAEIAADTEQFPAIFELFVEKGVKVIWGANPDESEIVLQRGCRYQIESIRKTASRGEIRWYVKARVLPPL